jgi:mitochondrial enoyl-[acyl-carrier protein] reductase / trans-2-enoyl-CoA reductase
MKKALHRRHGDPAEVIELVEAPDPEPGRGQVRVRLTAMTINPADLLSIEGRYGEEPGPLPDTPGSGAYGIVDEVGEGVERLVPGDAVLPAGRGFWAEFAVVDERMAPKAPEGVSPEQAAMMRANPATAWLMLTDLRALEPGDWVIQNAANSAVGRHVVRFAKSLGLRTANVVRRDAAGAPLTADGADAVIVDQSAAQVLAAALKESGMVAVYGLLSGEAPRVDSRELVFRDVTARGFWLARWFADASREDMAKLQALLAERIRDGSIDTPVEATYPLSRVREAVAHAARGGRDGKIVLTDG